MIWEAGLFLPGIAVEMQREDPFTLPICTSAQSPLVHRTKITLKLIRGVACMYILAVGVVQRGPGPAASQKVLIPNHELLLVLMLWNEHKVTKKKKVRDMRRVVGAKENPLSEAYVVLPPVMLLLTN